MILYLIQPNGYYGGPFPWPDDPTGMQGIPYGATVKEPPALTEGEYAVWDGADWYVTTSPPPPPPKDVPQSVTKYQGKMALLQFGLYDQIDEYVRTSTDSALKISWNDTTNFERNNQFVASMAEVFELTNDQIDDLFILAATL